MKIIADACTNHENDWGKITRMIDEASELGIDYIKFQIFTAKKLNKKYPQYHQYKKHYSKLELKEPMINSIVLYCKNIKPLFTLFDVDKAEMLRKYSDEVKIASPDCNNWELLDVVFKMFNKVIISTGMHTLKEIETMLDRYKKYHKKMVVMYCKSQYPAVYKLDDFEKLRKLQFMAQKNKHEFSSDYHGLKHNFPVGISDHSENGIDVKHYGADYYEHHYTLEKTGKQDDAVSWTIQEFADFMGIGDEYENRLKYKTRWV